MSNFFLIRLCVIFFACLYIEDNLFAQVSSDTSYYGDRTIQKIVRKEGIRKHITVFYANGNKQEEYTLENDTLEGSKKTWNSAGQIQTEAYYLHGLINGVSRLYNSNGLLSNESNYIIIFKDNKRTSVLEGIQKSFYASGVPGRLTTFKNNKKNGPETEWYESGIKKNERNYRDGYNYGKALHWHESGKLSLKAGYDTILKSGRVDVVKDGICESYYKTGIKENSGKFIKGKRQGVHREWYESGQLKSQTTYDNDRIYGKSERWYDNGKLQYRYVGYVENDVRKKYQMNIRYVGKFEEYYQTGKPKTIGMYTKNGKKTGKWLTYGEGFLLEEQEFVKGFKINDDIFYYPNGKIKSIQKNKFLQAGRRDTSYVEGAYRHYFQDGTISQEGNYVKGKKQGIWKNFYQSGNLMNETYMHNNDNYTIVNEYFENGKPKMVSDIYIDSTGGKITASIVPVKTYDRNGQLRRRSSSFKGKALGLGCEWDEDGNLVSEYYIFKNADDYGRVGSFTNSWTVYYYSNGQVMKEIYSVGGESACVTIEWYITGKLKRVLKPYLYDFQWLQNGELMNASFYSNTMDVPKDTVADPQWLKKLYNSYSSTPNKSLHLEGVTKDGKIASYYDDKQIRFETYLVNGKPDLYFRGYYPDGSLLVEENLKNGIPHGKYELRNINGTLRYSGEYSEGKPVGLWTTNTFYGNPYEIYLYDPMDPTHKNYSYKKEYYDNGTLKTLTNYWNGNRFGKQESWHSNGQLSLRFEINNKGVMSGWREEFYSDGKVRGKKFYKDGQVDGLDEYWYENGKKQWEVTYKDGLKHGSYKWWLESGQLRLIGYYKDNMKDSLWVYYDSTGAVDYEDHYEKDVRIKKLITIPCGCEEPEYKTQYTPSLETLLGTKNIQRWEFPFHESIQKYIEHLFFSGLQNSHSRQESYFSMDLFSYEPLEVGLPDKEGLALILNPCFGKGRVSKIRVSANLVSKDPRSTSITLESSRLAFRYKNDLLVPEDPAAKETKAYFSADYIHYGKSGIDLTNPVAVCFPVSRVAKTGMYISLTDFHPAVALSVSKSDRIRSDMGDYSSLISSDMTNNFVGIIGGSGIARFTLENEEMNVSLKNFAAARRFLAATLVFDNATVANETITFSASNRNFTMSREELKKYFSGQGFKADVSLPLDPKPQKLMVKLIYTIK